MLKHGPDPTMRSFLIEWLGPIIFFVGMIFNYTPLAWVGVILFAGVALFALVTLPVEFDASRRAKEQLLRLGFIRNQESAGVSKSCMCIFIFDLKKFT